MAPQKKAESGPPPGIPKHVTSEPLAAYDPLDLKTLAESMVRVVLEQPIHPLGSLEPFEGSGIYVIYYTGRFKPYRPIAEQNRNDKWERPIYVGEATRKGGRKGGVLAEGPPGRAIYERLGNHADSIRSVSTLRVEDFWCRYLVLKDFFIPLCESLLIDRYKPIWNRLVEGFGNKDVDVSRRATQARSMWDVLHPGRAIAAGGPNKRYPDPTSVVKEIEKFFAGEPVPLIPTDDALEAAEDAGKT
jgi:hypothetical protein